MNLALRFVLELAMLAALAAWGVHTGRSTAADLALGIGAPAVAAILWGRYAAPRSAARLRGVALRVLQLFLLGLGAAALIAAGWVLLGVIFALAIAVNALLLELWGQNRAA